MGGKREDEQAARKSLVGGGALAAGILALTRRAVKGSRQRSLLVRFSAVR